MTTLAAVPGIAFPAATLGLLAIDDVDALDLSIVPEPSTFLLCVVGLIGLAACAWRRRRCA